MADFWKGLGVAVLSPPGVWDNTSGRWLAEMGAGAFDLLFVILVALVLPEPLVVGRFREKIPWIPVALENNFRTFRKGTFFPLAAASLGAGIFCFVEFAVKL
jgi:hypothetical protein